MQGIDTDVVEIDIVDTDTVGIDTLEIDIGSKNLPSGHADRNRKVQKCQNEGRNHKD